jgi:hypothetical protein
VEPSEQFAPVPGARSQPQRAVEKKQRLTRHLL